MMRSSWCAFARVVTRSARPEVPVATELYDLTVPAFVRGLGALAGLLEKARAHAASTGADAESYLALRIIDDMHPLSKQIQIACDAAKLAVSRISGVPAPVNDDSERTLAELEARIAATVAYLRSVPRDAVDGQEGKEVVLTFPRGQMTFDGRSYVTGFALPNFYFHVTTAYGLLRGQGVPLGKGDYLGAGR